MGFFNFGDFDWSNEYYGEIEYNRIEIRKRKSWFWRNDFAPHWFATLIPVAGGTRIEGYFSVGTRIKIFMILWALVLGIASGRIFFGSVSSLLTGQAFRGNGDLFAGLLGTLGISLFVVMVPRIGYYFSFWHERELMDFAKETLLAEEVEGIQNSIS